IVRGRGNRMDTGLNDLTTGRDDALYPRAAEPASAPQPASRGMQLVQWIVGGIGGFALVAGLDSFADDVSLPLLAAMLALAIAMLWLQVLVHEAGHAVAGRSEEHTSELQSREKLVCRRLLEKKKERTTP